jgi:hypothetical protein
LEATSAVLLHVESNGHGPNRLRFCAYGAHAIGFGIQWGTCEGTRFSKSLELRPRLAAKGRRFDVERVGLLHTALNLFEAICRAEEHEIVEHLQLPQAWAAFDADYPVSGDGPELNGDVHRSGMSTAELMVRCRRWHQSQELYPLEWVSHEPLECLYVEPATVPTVQIIRCDNPDEVLRGHRGAAAYDFVSDIFRAPLVSCSDLRPELR